MKKKLIAIILITLVTNLSCIGRKKNEAMLEHTLVSGENIKILNYLELLEVFPSEKWVMKSSTEIPSLSSLKCGDEKLNLVANEIWKKLKQTAEKNNLESGLLHLKQNQNRICGFVYWKKENGEWSNY